MHIFFIFLFLFVSIASSFELNTMFWLALVLVSVIIIDFLNKIGRSLPFLNILGLSACISWMLAPTLFYYASYSGWYKGYLKMPIPPETYFEVAAPGTLALLIGLYLPLAHKNLNVSSAISKIIFYNKTHKRLWLYLFITGIVSAIILPYAPLALRQIFYLSRNLMFIGLYYFIYTNYNKSNIRPMLWVIVFSLVISVYSGMFGDFIFWSLFIWLIYQMSSPSRFSVKLILFALGIFSVLLLQSIKIELRDSIWYNRGNLAGKSGIEVFLILATEKISKPNQLFEPKSLGGLLERLNQGYITGSAIYHTPANEPYAKGETIFLASLASLVPRFLWPDKPNAGGKENVTRFTNLIIQPGTSMNIAPLGDAYVNFGASGGAFFLFFYGLLLNTALVSMIHFLKHNPLLLIWLPLIFIGLISAETDVVTTFNHGVKAIFFTFVILYILPKPTIDKKIENHPHNALV